MRQNASEWPVKEPRDSKRSDDLLTNMMDWKFEKNEYLIFEMNGLVVLAGKSDSRQMVTNVSLRRKRDNSRSTRGEANICHEQERGEEKLLSERGGSYEVKAKDML